MPDTKRLRFLADFLDEHGVGVGDHSDSPFLRDVADDMDRMRATITEVATAIQAGGLAAYVPVGPGKDATVSLAECITGAAAEIKRRGQLHLDEFARGTKLAESAAKIGEIYERVAVERDRYRAALEMLAQVRHVSGSAQGAMRSNLRLVDAVLEGADVRSVETVEAIAAGRWKPPATPPTEPPP